MNGSWLPLLDEDHATQALAIAREVADAVSRGEGEEPPGFSPRQIELWRNVVGTGKPAFSLLDAYLFWCGAGEEHADRAIAHLDEATDFMASVRMSESLYYGFPGIGWVTAHLSGRLFEDDPEDGVDLDGGILQFLNHPSRPGEYDLLNGYVGLGIYAQ